MVLTILVSAAISAGPIAQVVPVDLKGKVTAASGAAIAGSRMAGSSGFITGRWPWVKPSGTVRPVETDPGIAGVTIFRPKELSVGKGYPIAAWGQGGCSKNGLSNREFQAEIASHGYVVLSDGAPNLPALTTFMVAPTRRTTAGPMPRSA